MMPSEENPTPLVRINRLNPHAEFPLFAKLEWMNPFGSVKDRAAWALLRDLEERGELENGHGLVEPTSGNTGISLAALARACGHRLLAIVPNKVPYEKKVLLKIAGADLEIVSDELCPAPGLGDGSINLAKIHAKASAHKYVMPNQYENAKNEGLPYAWLVSKWGYFSSREFSWKPEDDIVGKEPWPVNCLRSYLVALYICGFAEDTSRSAQSRRTFGEEDDEVTN